VEGCGNGAVAKVVIHGLLEEDLLFRQKFGKPSKCGALFLNGVWNVPF